MTKVIKYTDSNTLYQIEPNGSMMPISSPEQMTGLMISLYGNGEWRYETIDRNNPKPIQMDFNKYVDSYEDLLGAFGANSGGLSKSEWGRKHYQDFGAGEGRIANPLLAVAPQSMAPVSSGPSQGGGSMFSGSVNFGKETNQAWLPFVIIGGIVLVLIFRPFKFLSGLFK